MLFIIANQMILLAAFMLLFLGSYFLFWKYSKTTKILGCSFISEFYRITTEVLTTNFEQIYFISFSSVFLTYGLFYIYIISFIRDDFKIFIKRNYLLFTPCIIDILYKIYWLFQSQEASQNHLNSHSFYLYDETFETLTYLYGIVIQIIIIDDIEKYLNKKPINLHFQWLKKIAWALLGLNIFWLIDDLQTALYLYKVPTEYFEIISGLFFLITVCWLGYIGLATSFGFITSKDSKVKRTDLFYDLNPERQNVYTELEIFLQETKMFKKNDLTLSDLSKNLNIRKTSLSRAINAATGNNYYHYINNLRLKEFKTLINTDKGQKMTIEGLAKEAGFGSKATFYSFFKKVEGVTPKIYQNRLCQ